MIMQEAIVHYHLIEQKMNPFDRFITEESASEGLLFDIQ